MYSSTLEIAAQLVIVQYIKAKYIIIN